MNWRHLSAFVWLRWRLMVNQWRRAGALNGALMMLVAIGSIVTAVPSFFGCLVLGQHLIPRASPVQLMYAWDAVIVTFLFFWSIGLITELQRAEPLSLSKFLHLPVSAYGAFLINYLSSFLRLSLIAFVPVMLGFSLALVSVKGMSLLPVLALLAAFLLMVTALTYQFQGWLASLMENPRRRRTVIVVTTMVFILVFQLPNLVSVFGLTAKPSQMRESERFATEFAELNRAFQAKEINSARFLRRSQELMKEQDQLLQSQVLVMRQAERERNEHAEHTARLANMILPVGWLPFGVMTAAEGRPWPSLLGILGMTLIGAVSLRQSCRGTVGQYQGQFSNRKGRRALAAVGAASPRRPGLLLLEARLPGLSEPVSAVALGGFRSLSRSPELKMMLLTPIVLAPISGSFLWTVRHDLPESVRPLIAIGGMAVVLLGVIQLMGNQFGFDRDGFRVFVLSSTARRDIILGKNLSFAPLVLGMGAIVLSIVQWAWPMRLDHLLSMFPHYVSMFLLFCIVANLVSIYAPVHIPSGSLRAASPKLITVVVQLAIVLVLFPLTQGATLLPLGIEAALSAFGQDGGVPIGLLLSLAECAAIVIFYRYTLDWQGRLFQAREHRILECVTNRAH